MLELKYKKGVEKAQKMPASHWRLLAPFDFDDIAAQGFLARISARLFTALMPAAFWLLREFWPLPRIGRLVIVTRADDVRQVLQDDDHFTVPYGPEMTELAGGQNFVLGLDGRLHEKQHEIVKSVLRTSDVDRLVAWSGHTAATLIQASAGTIDVMNDLITRVATETCARYFGLKLADADAYAQWTMAISLLLFADPFGDENTRRRALYAAGRVRGVLDLAVREASQRSSGATDDTVVDRLTALKQRDSSLDDGTISATLMGLAVGFVPTTTLAAGKILQELLRRPDQFERACRKARAATQGTDAKARGELEDILFEAARFSPALAPGQWRYAEHDQVLAAGTLRRRKVRAGTVLLVSTMSALRDRRAFANPGAFVPGRGADAELMFGDGSHFCLGKAAARAVITEILRVLLALPGLKPYEGAAGRIQWSGAFPRRLDMQFEPSGAPRGQSMITIALPVLSGALKSDLQSQISRLGNPAGDAIAGALDETNIVHFASLAPVEASVDGNSRLLLLLELNVDGPAEPAIRKVAKALKEWLDPVFAHVRPVGDEEALGDLLWRHRLELHERPWGAIGLNFNGTPEFSVVDIETQDRLARFARDALDSFLSDHVGLGSRAMAALNSIRGLIRSSEGYRAALKKNPKLAAVYDLAERGAGFADFLIRPGRQHLAISSWREPSGSEALSNLATSRDVAGVWAFVLAIFAFSTVVVWRALASPNGGAIVGSLLLTFLGAVAVTVLFFALLLGGFAYWLRRSETADQPDDSDPEVDKVAALARAENHPGFVQNHITAVVPMKPGWFRRVTLAVSLWGIRLLVTYWFRPGFVLNMGTIHYAKWFRIPKSDSFIFQANYDGSWESYLEDFIMKAHQGQSAAWSVGVGFPRTRFLVLDGAQDGDRFKRWVRRQQVVTPFWYTRFRHLTTENIRTNALIHDGLARAATDDAARAWIECFGSMQRPDNVIETSEVQSLIFRAIGRLEHSICALLQLPGDIGKNKAWLNKLLAVGDAFDDVKDREHNITFGDFPLDEQQTKAATFLAFSAQGLRKFAMPDSDGGAGLGTFPAVFNIGMPARQHVLRDSGASAPDYWRWSDSPIGGDPKKAVDVALLIYGDSAPKCESLLADHLRMLGIEGWVAKVKTAPAPGGLEFEHFGFRDGISQPVIRGTQRFAKGALPRDIVEPGEFILGYRNNQNYYPPTPTVDAEADSANVLPILEEDAPTQFPRFDGAASARRDFGRNGTFIVIRELEQHVDAFHDLAKRKAETLNRTYERLDAVIGGRATSEWVEAKMVGRWHDGTPLIDRPLSAHLASHRHADDRGQTACPHGPKLPENDFSYANDDPRGLHCPLGAHIRRANPRDSLEPDDPMQQQITNRHRLLRRGRSYERDASDQSAAEKGLLFVALCADLERQFEFVQQTWLGAETFHRLSREPDPIVSQAAAKDTVFTIPTASGPLRLTGMESVVTVKAGGYFFLPSRSAIQYLAGSSLHPVRWT